MGENAACTMYLEINGQFPLDSEHIYLVGKSLSTTKEDDTKFINLKDVDGVDEKHCLLEVGVSDVYIFDLISLKGTYLNNERLKPLQKKKLKNGDQFTVGMQQVKFCHERMDMSMDSSGFLEVNKNTSDMIASSPESISQREIRTKRLNNNNFLMPTLPAKKLATSSNSFIIPETEVNTSKVSLNSSVISRKSDSFTIPETQYCKPRSSINTSNLSIAESIPDVNLSKNKFDFNLDDDDEFCIPETQDVISCSQRPRLLTVDNKPKEKNIAEEKTLDLQEDTSLDGSQFRICTQDYNEGFGEEAETLTSQIIPIIKYDMVILNKSSSKSATEIVAETSKLASENDIEISALKLSSFNTDHEATDLRSNCTTPDIFDFDNINDNASPTHTKEQIELTKEIATPPVLEDEEDLMPTQVFPSINAKSSAVEKRTVIEKEPPCLEKEKEYILTLSDKENRYPSDLEPITDLPPTQLFAKNDARASASTSSCKSIASKSEASLDLNPSTSAAALINNNLKTFLNFDADDEDDLLTQAFLKPSKPSLTINTKSHPPANSFNSTLLDDKVVSKNPAAFFAEMEKIPIKHTTPPGMNTFKMPDIEFSSLKKTSSATSNVSESDLDLIMCTPQLIVEHMQVNRNDDLKKSLLAAKHKNLFGDETEDEEENGEEGKNKERYLVELINVRKDTKDFDTLLPHLNNINNQSRTKKKNTVTQEQKDAIEAYKDYKFNISFGFEQEANKTINTSNKSSSLSRDERLAARDKSSELAQLKVNEKKQKESRSRKAKTADNQEKKEKEEQKNATKLRKRQQSDDQVQAKATTTSTNKNQETKKSKSSKTENNSKETEAQQMPARRTTRFKSKLNENPSTSKETLSKEKAIKNINDDNDEISTQPFVRSTRSHSSTKQSESEESVTSSKKNQKTLQSHVSKNSSSTSVKSSLNESTSKTNVERKRKAETHTQHATTERKRLRSTSSQDLSSTHSTTATKLSSMRLISMTMVEPQLFQELVKHSAGLWSVALNPTDSEILVMDKAYRTFKFFLAMARGIPIVNSNWLKKVNKEKSLEKSAINDYLFSDPEFEKKHKFSFKKSLRLATNKRLFEGYEFLMTSGITPNPTEIKAIIEAAGGCVHLKTPPARSDQRIFLISSKNDKKDWHTFRRLNKNIVIISTEAIMSSVMRQSCSPLCTQNNVLA